MIKMKNSGHSEQYRKEILESTLHAFEEMIKADCTGEQPLYRDKNWQKELRRHEQTWKKYLPFWAPETMYRNPSVKTRD